MPMSRPGGGFYRRQGKGYTKGSARIKLRRAVGRIQRRRTFSRGRPLMWQGAAAWRAHKVPAEEKRRGSGDAWRRHGGAPRRYSLPGGENSGGAAKPRRGAAPLLSSGHRRKKEVQGWFCNILKFQVLN